MKLFVRRQISKIAGDVTSQAWRCMTNDQPQRDQPGTTYHRVFESMRDRPSRLCHWARGVRLPMTEVRLVNSPSMRVRTLTAMSRFGLLPGVKWIDHALGRSAGR